MTKEQIKNQQIKNQQIKNECDKTIYAIQMQRVEDIIYDKKNIITKLCRNNKPNYEFIQSSTFGFPEPYNNIYISVYLIETLLKNILKNNDSESTYCKIIYFVMENEPIKRYDLYANKCIDDTSNDMCLSYIQKYNFSYE